MVPSLFVPATALPGVSRRRIDGLQAPGASAHRQAPRRRSACRRSCESSPAPTIFVPVASATPPFLSFWDKVRAVVVQRTGGIQTKQAAGRFRGSVDPMKARARAIIASDRTDLSPDVLARVEKEIAELLARYVEYDDSKSQQEQAVEALEIIASIRSDVLKIFAKYVEASEADLSTAIDESAAGSQAQRRLKLLPPPAPPKDGKSSSPPPKPLIRF
eukprot:tig00001224_g7635.t1